MKRHPWLITTLAATFLAASISAQASVTVRIKDIVRFAGLTPVEVVGYGVVIGLNGTGDKDLKLTKQTMANLLQNFDITLPPNDIKSKNVAAVIVTAVIPPFHAAGDRVDVQVSSIGDASSLQGGQLLMTPLISAEGELYALAQGSITVAGFNVGAGGIGGEGITKNTPTSGLIPSAAQIRFDHQNQFYENGILRLVLRHPDFTTASRAAESINQSRNGIAVVKDAGTVLVEIPQDALDTDQVAMFIARMESLPVQPDAPAKVVVNERTGTIVMGQDVRIAPAVVAHGNLIVSIKSMPLISQPAPFSELGQTVLVGDVATRADEDSARVVAFKGTATVQDLANLLNTLGASTSDIISILEALSRVGALQMELVTM